MRAVVQRVLSADVTVEGQIVGEIENGFVVLLGVGHGDASADVRYLADKIIGLRVFEDGEGKMNLSLADVAGCLLVVSQFTLFGDCRKGRRPSFVEAAPPEMARSLYEEFVAAVRSSGIHTQTGVFQADMKVQLVNDGPVTLLLDSKKQF